MLTSQQKIKWIVFDCFGVISSEVFWPWVAKADPNFKQREDVYDAICKQGDIGAITADELANQLAHLTGIQPEDIFAGKEKEVVINQKVIELIKSLKTTYRIGMISDANAYFLEKLLSDFDLNQYFDQIIISSKVKFTKANGPEIFQIFMSQAQIHPDEIIFIDNAKKNVALATSLGIKSIWYQNFEQLKEELEASLKV